MSLVGYANSDDDDDDDEDEEQISCAPLAMNIAHADDNEDDDEDDDEEEEEDYKTAEPVPASAALPASAAPVAPPQVSKEPPPAVPETTMAVTEALPPPDFTNWVADPSQAPPRLAPKVSVLGKQKRGSSAAQISSGFKAAITRRDQIIAEKAQQLAEEDEARSRNGGLSSAYDSVFHGANAEDVEGAVQRTKVNKKGRVVNLSKKEVAREEALEASLR